MALIYKCLVVYYDKKIEWNVKSNMFSVLIFLEYMYIQGRAFYWKEL